MGRKMGDGHPSDEADHDGSSGGDHHASTDHGGTHGHDDHGHGAATLGPIDVAAWGAGVLGVAIAVVMAIAFAMATSSPA